MRRVYAFDAIPVDAIRLVDAFKQVAEALYAHPEIPVSEHPVAMGLLEMSRERERQALHLADTSDSGEGHLFFKDANLFFANAYAEVS